MFGNVFDFHPRRPHCPHLTHNAFGQFCFVMSFASGFASVFNRVRMVVLGKHPFKVFNAVIKAIKVFVVDGISSYTNITGRLSNECKSYKLVNSWHPFDAFALKKNKKILLDFNGPKLPAANFSPIGEHSRQTPNTSIAAYFVVAAKWFPGYWFPCGHMQLYQLTVFPGNEGLLSILERNGIPLD